MKLKIIVASMSMLGLASCPVIAATAKHKHHHKKHHAMAVHQDYKNDYKNEIAPLEVCTISHTSAIMSASTQSLPVNMGSMNPRSMPNPCNPGWFNRIQLSGGINVDFGKWGNRNANYMGENYQRISLNDAYLNIGATVTDWAKAFASISYNSATINAPELTTLGPVAEYSPAYSNNVSSGSSNVLQLEQAYATFANFDVSPVYLQVGKEFQDFSRYTIHPITRSLTQVMSETLATSAKLGFIMNGFNGAVSVFDDPISKVGATATTTNYSATLGYDMPSDQLGYDLGIAYLYNLVGVNDVAYIVNQWNATAGGGYNTRVAGGAFYGDINSGPFVLSARYTQALQRFNQNDLPKYGYTNLVGAVVSPTATGAKPWAAGLQAAYGFAGWNRNQNVYVGYQASREAAALDMPKGRWLVGYGIDAFGKDTNVGLEWDHDQGYSSGNGGNGKSTNLVTLRAGVNFG
jgi:hypothetical protein